MFVEKWYIAASLLLFIIFERKTNFSEKALIVLFLFCFLMIGWVVMSKKIQNIDNRSTPNYQGVIFGDVASISNKDQKVKLLLQNVVLTELDNKKLKYVSLLLRHKAVELQPGDRVFLKVKLEKPKQDNLPGTFNFVLYAFFKEINGVGHSLSTVKISQLNHNMRFIDKIRKKIENSIYDTLPIEISDVAIAFFLGNTKNIDKSIFHDVRISGLAHLFAISGMHIALFAGLIFICCNFILNNLKYEVMIMHIHKIIAVITVITTFCYLVIAQAPISAQRAFIMTFLLLVGVIIDRQTNPQSTITIAATLILFSTPEAIISPGFQMSFAASIGLIYGFKVLRVTGLREFHGQGNSIKVYFQAIFIASVIATAITSVYSFYHFKSFALYAILANLIAIPITEFLIMPFGLVGIILVPINLEFLGYFPMELGIRALLFLANNIAKLPYAEIKVKSVPVESLVFFTLGLAFLIIMSTEVKKYCLIFFIMMFIEYYIYVEPDLVISKTGKLIAVKDRKDGKLFFVRNIRQNYLSKIWQENMHFKKISKDYLRQYCDENYCFFSEYHLCIIFDADAPHNDCGSKKNKTVMINLSQKKIEDKKNYSLYIDYVDLLQKGAHQVWFKGNKCKIEYAASALTN